MMLQGKGCKRVTHQKNNKTCKKVCVYPKYRVSKLELAFNHHPMSAQQCPFQTEPLVHHPDIASMLAQQGISTQPTLAYNCFAP